MEPGELADRVVSATADHLRHLRAKTGATERIASRDQLYDVIRARIAEEPAGLEQLTRWEADVTDPSLGLGGAARVRSLVPTLDDLLDRDAAFAAQVEQLAWDSGIAGKDDSATSNLGGVDVIEAEGRQKGGSTQS